MNIFNREKQQKTIANIKNFSVVTPLQYSLDNSTSSGFAAATIGKNQGVKGYTGPAFVQKRIRNNNKKVVKNLKSL